MKEKEFNVSILKVLLPIFLFFCIGAVASAQNVISGKVTDSKNEPLIGVTVIQKGSTNGVVTDIDGIYKITVSSTNTTLVFSFIGYKRQEIVIGNQRNIDVVLAEETELLDEVVVVGFQSQKKVNLTGAVASVSSDVLENRPVTNISQALQGVVPNLNVTISDGNPKSFASYNVRGSTSMDPSGNVLNGSPLILVDGIEMENFNFSAINPNDIDNISVIKDASASAIYGARAAYGVVLVTTQKGKAGKSKVNYSFDIQWNHPASKPNFMDAYTAEYAQAMAGVYAGGAITSLQEARLEGIRKYQQDRRPENAWMYTPGSTTSIEWVGDFDPYELMVKEWAPTQKHTVSAAGGTDAIRYYASFGYQNQEGFFKSRTDVMKRYNGMANLDIQLTKRLYVGVKLSYNATNYNEPLSYGYAGNPWSIITYQRHWHANMPPLTGADDPIPNHPTNSIVSTFANSGRIQTTSRSVATFTISPEYQLLPGLKLKADISYRPSTYNVKDVQPQFSFVDKAWATVTATGTENDGYISEIKESVDLYTTNIYADFSKKLWKKHTISSIIGFNQELWERNQLNARNTGIVSNGAPSLNNTYGENKTVGEIDDHWAVRGAFGRINYNYDDKYLFEFNSRYDGTSKFPKHKRFKFFPSVSGAWRISQESFMNPAKEWLNNLKLRASWGAIGNQNVSNYLFYTTMSTGKAAYIIDGVRPYQINNPPSLVDPNFTWETATTLNGGIDFAAFSNRLDVSFDIYTRKTTDIIMAGATYPTILGTSAPNQNSGILRTNGWELSLGWRDRLSCGLSYSVKFVLSDYQSKVISFEGNDKKALSTLYSGKKVGEIWGYVTDRILQAEDIENNLIIQYTDPNGKSLHKPNEYSGGYYPGDIMYKDIDGDGKVDRGSNTLDDHGDLKVIGNNTPRYQYGLTANLSYKGFDLSLFFQGIGKRDVWIGDNTWKGNIEGLGNWDVYNNSWTPERTDAKYPVYNSGRGHNWYTQTGYLFDGSYLKLKQMILGYTIPKNITGKVGLERVRFSVSGYNIFKITDVPDVYDPDLLSVGYPQLKSIALGVQVSF